jgi:succinoglycan biosynthesis transport protein ExoP
LERADQDARAQRKQEDIPLELRQYLEVLKRHKWLILEAIVVVALVAGISSSLKTPLYRSTAQVLLRPNDPTEQLNPLNNRGYSDPDRYVTGQRTIIGSEAVAREAAKFLPPGTSIGSIEGAIGVAQGGRSDILNISATHSDPVRAKDLANAVAKGYIENRRQAAVSGLEQAAKDIEEKLGPLLTTIANYDAQIAGEPPPPAGTTNRPQSAAQPATVAPTQPATGAPVPPLNAGGAPTTQEALKAARYSAALQYETLFSRQQELLVDISLKRGEAEIVADAKTGFKVGPNPRRDGIMGGIVGLLIGVGIAFLREQLDDRVRSAEEVERVTGKTVLAQLPLSDEVGPGMGVAAVERPLSPLSEAVRSLRTSVQYASIDQPVKVVMVTSASPSEGKSLVAANLAVTFAQSDRRTILISGDLRRATLDEIFLEKKPLNGLTTLVLQRATAKPEGTNGSGAKPTTPAGVLVKTGVPNLLLLPSGPVPPNPAEIMGSRRLASLLDEYSAASDMLIIDTPPLLPVTDAAVLAERVDGVVMVVALNETRREALKRAMAILEGTGVRILGVVVNKSTGSGTSDYYAYYGDAANNGGGATRRWPLRSKKAASSGSGGTHRSTSSSGEPSRSARAEVK